MESFRFQAVDWREDADTHQYTVRVYGRDMSGSSVSALIKGYRPCFYVKLPLQTDRECSFSDANKNIGVLQRHLSNIEKVSIQLTQSADFWGFRPEGTKFWFAKVICCTKSSFMRAKRTLAPNHRLSDLGHIYKSGFRLYETNIEPLTRMFHVTGIKPCGILEVNDYKVVGVNYRKTTCVLEVECEYANIKHVDLPELAPIRTACFDIEASSSHGDFPLAKKTFSKLISQIQLAWDRCDVSERVPSKIREWMDVALGEGSDEISKIYPKDVVREQMNMGIGRICQNIFAKLQTKSEIEDIDTDVMKAVACSREEMTPLEGDMCIQIGLTINELGHDVSERHVVVIGNSEPIEGAKVHECKTEAELFIRFANLIRDSNIDILSGFNTWGFDWDFMMDRCEQLEFNGTSLYIPPHPEAESTGIFLETLSKHTDQPAIYIKKKLSSSALGDNFLKFVDIPGVAQFDLMKYAQKEYKLDSYSLRNVSTHFLKETKVDLSPQELFSRFKSGTPEDIRIIAEYAIQDCALCNKLITKLDIVPGSFAMANVSIVNFMTLYVAGQTKKVQSLLLAETLLQGMLVPSTQDDPEIGGYPDKICHSPNCQNEPIYGFPNSPGPTKCIEHRDDGMVKVVGFQGAIVLPPRGMDGSPGGFISLDHPCAAQDFASLYPSCIRSRGMCHSSIILDKDRDKYMNLEGYEYYTSEFDTTDHLGNKLGVRQVTYCHKTGKTPVLPLVLEKLLRARKETRRRIKSKHIIYEDGTTVDGLLMEDNRVVDPVSMQTICDGKDKVIVKSVDTYSDLMKSQLECLQLAFKVSANSCYGALTAPGSAPLKLRDIGQSVTAEGRAMVMLAKKIAEENGGVVRYGDTDSVFVAWPDVHNVPDAVRRGKELEKIINDQLPPCQEIELEKIAFPMILFTPKRYCYMTHDPDEPNKRPKFVAMGIQIKKRDTSQILKKCQQGMIDCILCDQSTEKAMRFLETFMESLIAGKFDLEDMVISKALRATYKNPESIAHKVLAERIAARNQFKPQANDRIPYAYIIPKNPRPGMLQGERIEHPDWIRQNPDIKVDIGKYIELISNPISQLIALFLDKRFGCYSDFSDYAPEMRQTMKERWVQREIFGPYLARAGVPNNQRTIDTMFTRAVKNQIAIPHEVSSLISQEASQASSNNMGDIRITITMAGKVCKTKSKPVKISMDYDNKHYEKEYTPDKMSLRSPQSTFTGRSLQNFINSTFGREVTFGVVSITAWKEFERIVGLADTHNLPTSRQYNDITDPDIDMHTRSEMVALGWLRCRCEKMRKDIP